MGTAERRLEILKLLCRSRHSTMSSLAKTFGVSVRTVQRDIYEIETTFRVPLCVKCGKHDGGVYVLGDYSFDRAYMCEDEIALLGRIYSAAAPAISAEDSEAFARMIKSYTAKK